jgi:hypothetical protein
MLQSLPDAGCPRAAALLAALLLLLLPAGAAGWMPATHGRIAADALEQLPAPLREALRPRLEDLKKGSVYPDVILMDFEHHAWCPASLCGDAPDFVAASFSALLRDEAPRPGWARLLAALPAIVPAGCAPRAAADPTESLAFRLGVISHYLADAGEPYHTVPFVEPVATRHLAFEREVDAGLDRLRPTFDGRHDDVAGRVRSLVVELALEANGELAAIDARGPRTPRFQEAVDRAYSRCVNAVADLWYALLTRVPIDEHVAH